MKLITLCLFVLVLSCGKQQANSIVLPGNQASGAEADLLSEALDIIQGEFDAQNVSVNIRSLPYHVSDLRPELAGYCMYKKGNPVGIVLNKHIFHNWIVETDADYGVLYNVLLHEIGHCYFDRAHDNSEFAIAGHEMHITYALNVSPLVVTGVKKTVMADRAWPFIPKTLWPYYVKEIAGLERISVLQDLENYVDVDVHPI